MVSDFLNQWPGPWILVFFLKYLTLLITCQKWMLEFSFFTWTWLLIHYYQNFQIAHEYFLWQDISMVLSYLSLWSWPSLNLAIIRGICVSWTHRFFTVIICWIVCDKHTYGLECKQVCGNCSNGETCHHVNGTCFHGCKEGVMGSKCTIGQR